MQVKSSPLPSPSLRFAALWLCALMLFVAVATGTQYVLRGQTQSSAPVAAPRSVFTDRGAEWVTAGSINTAFMASPVHPANIMSRYYHYVGTSWVKGSNGRWYIAVEFG